MKIKNLITNACALLLCCSITTMSYAQKQVEVDWDNFQNPFQQKTITPQVAPAPDANHTTQEKDNAYFLKFQQNSSTTTDNIMPTIQQAFDMKSDDKLKLKNMTTDNLGFTNYRYQQQYKNLDVLAGEVIVHIKNGQAQSVNGFYFKGLNIATQPALTSEAAIDKALKHINATQYQWEIEGNEEFYKQTNPNGTLRPSAVLEIASKDGKTTNPDFRLCYKVNVNAQKPLGVYDVYVDAQSGEVILKLNKIAHTDAVGTAQTRYSGTQSITADNTGNGYRLRETGRGNGIQTFDMNSGTNFNNAVDFTDNDNNWTAGGFALNTITVAAINNGWYTNFNENPATGGKPDLFILVGDANSNLIYTSSTQWNTDPTVTFSNIGLTLTPGASYSFQIWDNDNSASSNDLLGTFSFTAGSAGTSNYSGNGNSGTITLGTAAPDAGLDAHWGMEKTYDFFSTKLSRNSYDGNGAIIRSFVHYDNSFENAYWDPNNQIMVFGDGASTFSALTCVDVAGHEFSHAVISSTANLVYQGESGALNESFADIFGVAIEFFAKPTTANWTLGEEITQVAPNFLRSMSDPNGGLSPQPDTYNGTHWKDPNNSSFDNGGVHFNSGVQNYWFYLLANGGSGTNDNSDAFSVTGIGIDDATAIAYRNLSTYLTNSSNYLAAVTGSIQSAQDLFGAGSTQVTAVQNAWFAVGLANSASSACSGTTSLTDATGSFSDGSGSANYEDNLNCSWLIQPAGASTITLNFTAFDTESGFDTVTVYDGANASAAVLLAWTGNTLPSAVTSTTGAIFVRFASDANTNGQGWEADYTTSGGSFCSGTTTLSTATGSFSDGSGASNYGNNSQCSWAIQPPGATSITLDFTAFDTETNFDGVIAYDGLTINDPVLLNHSGSTLPAAVTSTGGNILVIFLSDNTVNQGGFDANYTSTGGNTFCGNTTMTDDLDVITDGSGTGVDYYDNSNCTWLIQPTTATNITLIFTEFALEVASPDGQTIYDAVEVYDGSDDSAPLLGTFYGTALPPAVSSTGGTMFVKFYSDGGVTAEGFSAYYTTATNSYCSGGTTLTAINGDITDGSATDDYGNGSECNWLIQPNPPAPVSLNFTAFDTELNYDFVVVYDGMDENAPEIANFSGSNIPNGVTSTGNEMFVLFVSDESIRGSGFEANYTAYPVSTAEIKATYNVNIFPNPFSNNLVVEYDLEEQNKVVLQIFDVLGRKVMEQNLGTRPASSHRETLSTGDLPTGSYILRLQIGEQEVNQKLMKY